MKKYYVPAMLFSISLSLAACVSSLPGGDSTGEEHSSSSEATTLMANVSYSGVLESQQGQNHPGTHQLTTKSSIVVYLESNDANLHLNQYEGKSVEVRGSSEPEGDNGETLVHVQEITVLEASEISSESSLSSSKAAFCGGIAAFTCPSGYICTDDLSDDCDPKNGGADCSGVCVMVSVASSKSVALSSSQKNSASASQASSITSKSSVSSVSSSLSSMSSSVSRDNSSQVTLMSKQNYSDASLWTQKYCTSHITYCVSAHKNWYFRSFGATTSSLWHVEFGMEDIESLGDGAITMKLLAGSSASVGGSSSNVVVSSGEAIGFFDWKDQHFEISGPEILKPAISFMIQSIVSYNPGE